MIRNNIKEITKEKLETFKNIKILGRRIGNIEP